MKIDDYFGPVVIDIDEWHEKPVRHRFIHGSFEGTYTKFILCFPEKENYEGRFVQFLQGGTGGSEYAGYSIRSHLTAFLNNAYYVESNQGHRGDMRELKGDFQLLQWKASVATAKYGREFAKEIYGEKPHHGYLYGGSGGGMRSINCSEAPVDIWDGFLPFIVNRNGLNTFFWSIAAWAGQILHNKIEDIVDATDPGGIENPFLVLENDLQRQALSSLYRSGFPRGAEAQLIPNPLWILGLQILPDPSYWDIFWTEPGFEGADKDPVATSLLIDEDAIVEEIITMEQLLPLIQGDPLEALLHNETRYPKNANVGLKIKGENPGRYHGCMLQLPNGRYLSCTYNINNIVAAVYELQWLNDVQPGDRVHIENRRMVAFTFHHRHFVSEKYPNMRHFFIDGHPIYRPTKRSLDFLPTPTGKIHGKMILVQHAQDRECWPDAIRPYIESVKNQLGDTFHKRFRIYWTENATHVVPISLAALTRYINYGSIIVQALTDLIKWVEEDLEPPPSSKFKFNEDGALILPDSASERLGIQPIVYANVNGGKRIDVKIGQSIILNGKAEAPPNTGYFVRIEWDFDGSGTFPYYEDLKGTEFKVQSSVEHTYNDAGVFFATFRAFLNRNGDKQDEMRHIVNQARVRIVVK
ncbi:MAG: hypothetical protein ACFFG0_09785 [Candidatus Thorarchaeota archaeon]